MHHIGLTEEEIRHLKHLIARLDAGESAEAAERRVCPRIDFNHRMWLHQPLAAGKPWMLIYSRNLSTGGLSFLTRSIFHAGAHLVIAHDLGEGQPMLALSRVQFCRAVEFGIQEVGLAFVAAAADPESRRAVPAGWLALALQSDHLGGRKFAMPRG